MRHGDSSLLINARRVGGERSWSRRGLLTRSLASAHVLLLLPSVALLAALSVVPFGYIVYLSLSNAVLGGAEVSFVGLRNWIRVIRDGAVLSSWQVTLTFGGIGLVSETVLGVSIALVFFHVPWGRSLFVTLFTLPIFVAPVVTGLLWRFLLNSSYGLYAFILQQFGIGIDILGAPGTALPAIILMDIWEWTPLVTLID